MRSVNAVAEYFKHPWPPEPTTLGNGLPWVDVNVHPLEVVVISTQVNAVSWQRRSAKCVWEEVINLQVLGEGAVVSPNEAAFTAGA